MTDVYIVTTELLGEDNEVLYAGLNYAEADRIASENENAGFRCSLQRWRDGREYLPPDRYTDGEN